MSQYSVHVKCPECGAEDSTMVEIEYFGSEEYSVTYCESCSNPYAIAVRATVEARPLRLVRGD